MKVILGNPPSKSNSYKIGGKSFYKSDPVKDYERSFFLQYKRTKKIECEFKAEITIYFRSKKSDLDGCFKIFFDCLQKVGAISNDNLCISITAKKMIDKLNPRIEFELTPIAEYPRR
jgi:Holliday junction resolvase RusA-like endonuclease